MEHTEHYKGFVIRAYEQQAGYWLAEISKADGTDLILLLDGKRHRSITTSAGRYSADEAIKFAKEGIDGGGMK